MPWEWWISRFCEEFHCLPSEAVREWRVAPAGLLETILECRAFAAAKQIVDHARNAKDIPPTPMTALVQEIEFDLAQQDLNARTAAHD